MSNIELSVTVLSFNNEQYIEDCLTSIVRQGIENYEVFIVDDCSRDNSVEVIKNFIKDKPQFTLIEKEKNSGGAVSSQLGIERSTGKYCAIIDSDDIIADGAYKRLIGRLEKDDSDLAVGLPLRYVSGYMFVHLSNENENRVFARDCVLETPKERLLMTNEVYYWNGIYRTEFLKSNKVEMPSGLLIADRIFLYQAIYHARRISIDRQPVYYWRMKNNPNKMSIMDHHREYTGIADRCDSFASQLRITLENMDQAEMNMEMWTNSIERLFYPFDQLLEYKEVDVDYIHTICERYRLLLCEFPGFFAQIMYGGNLKPKIVYYLKNLLEKNYDHILALTEAKGDDESYVIDEDRVIKTDVMDLAPEYRDSLINRAVNKDMMEFSIVDVRTIAGKTYVYGQVGYNHEKYGDLHVEKVIALSRYYRQMSYELPYDEAYQRFEITDLPEASYNFMVVCRLGDAYMMCQYAKNKRWPVRLNYETENYVYTSSKFGGNPFTIMRKNMYRILKKDDEYYLCINGHDHDIEKFFFYNIYDNEKTDLKEVAPSVYKLDIDHLKEGNNMLLVKRKSGICGMVSKLQFNNTVFEMREYKKLFISNRIEIIK